MIGDIVIVKKEHRNKAKQIIPKILKSPSPLVVGIYGVSGTGKTEVATCLADELSKKKIPSLVISLDDYYKTNFIERNEIRATKGINYVGLKEINWTALQFVIEAFYERETLCFRRINRTSEAIETGIVNSEGIKILIVEGLYAGYLRKFDLLDYAIFLEGNMEDTYKFRKERMKENPDDKFRQKILLKESRVVGQLRKYNDYII